MKKLIKRFSLILIFSILLLSIFACKYIDRGGRAPHICSFDDIKTITHVSCSSDGITESSCICGLSTIDLQPAYGHSFGQWQMSSNQTCSRFGKAIRLCKECGLIQERYIEKSDHTYIVTREKIDDHEFKRYECKNCDESFLLDAELSLPVQEPDDVYLFDRSEDFSFIVISHNDEEYVKNHLKIFDAYMDYIGNDNYGLFDYDLYALDNSRWLVKPKGSFTSGKTYRVQHSDGIFFEDYGFSQLVFSVEREESSNVSLSDKIIYMAALEKESPGYYPYSFEYSKESGNYFLSLEKADGLANGDIICVGSATCFEDVVEGDGNNTFGRIKAISALNDGRIVIVLKELTPAELFDVLDIYDSDVNNIQELTLPLNVEDRLKTILFDDEDFASLVSAMYTESLLHLENRGFTTSYKDFEEYLEAIKIVRESSNVSTEIDVNGNSYASASTSLKAIIEIPILFGEEEEQVGSLMAELSIKVDLQAVSLGLQMLENHKHHSLSNGGLHLSFDVTEESSAEIKLDIYSTIVYSADSTPYVFEVDTRKYHFANCSHISKDTNDKQATVSVYSMLGLVSDNPIVNECEFCKPATAMKQDICVLDKTQGIYHNAKCKSCFSTSPTNLVFTEEGSSMLSAKGYHPCDMCGGNANSFGTFESNMIDRIENNDFGDYVKQVIDSVIDSENIKKNLYVGAFSTSLCGLDREIILLSVGVNFRLEGTTHYSYKIQRTTTHGFRSGANEIRPYVSKFEEHTQATGFISPAFGDDMLKFESSISLLIAGFVPNLSE